MFTLGVGEIFSFSLQDFLACSFISNIICGHHLGHERMRGCARIRDVSCAYLRFVPCLARICTEEVCQTPRVRIYINWKKLCFLCYSIAPLSNCFLWMRNACAPGSCQQYMCANRCCSAQGKTHDTIQIFIKRGKRDRENERRDTGRK